MNKVLRLCNKLLFFYYVTNGDKYISTVVIIINEPSLIKKRTHHMRLQNDKWIISSLRIHHNNSNLQFCQEYHDTLLRYFISEMLQVFVLHPLYFFSRLLNFFIVIFSLRNFWYLFKDIYRKIKFILLSLCVYNKKK